MPPKGSRESATIFDPVPAFCSSARSRPLGSKTKRRTRSRVASADHPREVAPWALPYRHAHDRRRLMMGAHVLSAGHGYTYLTSQVAAHDAGRSRPAGWVRITPSAENRRDAGRAPGSPRWASSPAPGQRRTDAGVVRRGTTSERAAIAKQLRADGAGEDVIAEATALGNPFELNLASNEFQRQVAQLSAEWNRANGHPNCAPVPPYMKARIRTAVANALFVQIHGREAADAQELSGFVAAQSRLGSRAVAGFDLTFSPVKSVSAVWALAPAAVAKQIEAAHAAAVDDTIAWLERTATFTRLGANGVRQVDTRGLLAAAFLHRSSRAGDPDLHTHVAISNKVQTLDGRWRALDGRVLLKATVAASERYNTRLEAELRSGSASVSSSTRDPAVARSVRSQALMNSSSCTGRPGALRSMRCAATWRDNSWLSTAGRPHRWRRSTWRNRQHWRRGTQAGADIRADQRRRWRPRPSRPSAARASPRCWRASLRPGSRPQRVDVNRFGRRLDVSLTECRPTARRGSAGMCSPRLSVSCEAWTSPIAQLDAGVEHRGSPSNEILHNPDAVRRPRRAGLTATPRRRQRVSGRRIAALHVTQPCSRQSRPSSLRQTRSTGTARQRRRRSRWRCSNRPRTGWCSTTVRATSSGSSPTRGRAVSWRSLRQGPARPPLCGSWSAPGERTVDASSRSRRRPRPPRYSVSHSRCRPTRWPRRCTSSRRAAPGARPKHPGRGRRGRHGGHARPCASGRHALSAGASIRLVGDDRQLAAIGAGGVLRDLAESRGAARLTEAMRFADPAEAPPHWRSATETPGARLLRSIRPRTCRRRVHGG